MAQTVSNDALWGKLKEMDEKLDKLSEVRVSPEITLDLKEVKEEITTEIKEDIQMLNGNILNTLKEVSLIRKQQIVSVEPQKKDTYYFNFKFFKVRKMPFVVAIFGLLVFILTLFCMKQQNDYKLLMDEYHKQNVTIQKLNEELKIYEENNRKPVSTKRQEKGKILTNK